MKPFILFFFFLSVASTTYAFFSPSRAEVVIRQRVRNLRRSHQRPENDEMQRPFTERVMKPFTDGLQREALRWTPEGVKHRARVRLAQAGNPIEVGRLLGLRVLSALFAAGAFILIATMGISNPDDRPVILGLGIAATVMASMVPEVWLGTRISHRRKALERALPNVLDLLCVSVEAGLGFDSAMQKVGEKFGRPISDEFGTYLKEVRLGKSRANAMRALAVRAGIPEMQSLATTIIQAEQLGLGLARVLRVQADQLRQKRRQRAEERAMKTPVMMLFPLVFFIFPTIFLVILGPVVLQLMEVFGE